MIFIISVTMCVLITDRDIERKLNYPTKGRYMIVQLYRNDTIHAQNDAITEHIVYIGTTSPIHTSTRFTLIVYHCMKVIDGTQGTWNLEYISVHKSKIKCYSIAYSVPFKYQIIFQH